MAKQILSDRLWELLSPALPPDKPRGGRGRPPISNRVALRGLLFVLKTGIAWEDFPQELGCSYKTLQRRLDEWIEAGIWQRLHQLLLIHLQSAGKLDWSRASADSASVAAPKGGR